MRPEQIAAGFLLIGFFVSLTAWIWVVWPREDPTSDRLYQARERRRR